MVTLKEEDSNIFGEVEDEMKKASADYQAVKLEVDTLKADNKTVSKEKKKEKYEKVFWYATMMPLHSYPSLISPGYCIQKP